MANPEHIAKLMQGVGSWIRWRDENPLNEIDLSNAAIPGSDLRGMDLRHVNLTGAVLFDSKFWSTHLEHAILRGADLSGCDFTLAELNHANLSEVILSGAILENTILDGADLTGAVFHRTHISASRFTDAKGLNATRHNGPSFIDVRTLYMFGPSLPETFLLGCGVPQNLLDYLPTLIQSASPIQFNSCFISYSHQDEEFARCLHHRLRQMHVPVWYAPEDMKGGKKLHEQVFSAVHLNDKLLLVLSHHSMSSEWVRTEIRRARKREREERRQVLFPIRLVSMDEIRNWDCFDADSGKDLAVEIREYFIPDFSDWTDQNTFDVAFGNLVRDLRTQA